MFQSVETIQRQDLITLFISLIENNAPNLHHLFVVSQDNISYSNTHLFQPLLLQADDIQVKICPQSIGLVE